jgi:hypothetical protein
VEPTAPTSPLATSPAGSVPQAVVPIPALDVLPPPQRWKSAIVPDFPELFEDFKKKQFTLLWRGIRTGFRASDFHSRRDGHSNTLTVILDTDGNLFGAFTPVEWESRTDYLYHKADPSLKRFLFTLKNPRNFRARRFALKATKKDQAIYCYSSVGPHFADIRCCREVLFDLCVAAIAIAELISRIAS